MKTRRWIVGIGTLAVLAMAAPAQASSPTASCIGQQLSVYGPAFGADLGAAVSSEARNPEVLGHVEPRRLDQRRCTLPAGCLPGGLKRPDSRADQIESKLSDVDGKGKSDGEGVEGLDG